jgi:hypothetical protein
MKQIVRTEIGRQVQISRHVTAEYTDNEAQTGCMTILRCMVVTAAREKDKHCH